MPSKGTSSKSRKAVQLLDRFLVDNDELEDLSARLSIFNVFKVLQIENMEIKHSNVLAWLLDPHENHGLGDVFLRKFISNILLNNDTIDLTIGPAQVELMDLSDVTVWRENENIDLLATSLKNNLVLLIENKIKAKATKRQLEIYLHKVKKRFPKQIIIPLLVTLQEGVGEEVAQQSGYLLWSHAQLYTFTQSIISQRIQQMPHDVQIFIEHYLNTLRRLTMQDEQLIELCKSIYRKHRDAIDLIVQWGMTSQFGVIAEDFIAGHPDLMLLSIRTNNLWFIPNKWADIMPPCSTSWKHLTKPYPVACWFVFDEKYSKVGFIIEVGSIKDSNKRVELLLKLKDEGFSKISNYALRPEAKYTRFYSIYRSINQPDDPDSIIQLMEQLWNKSAQKIETVTQILKSFRW